MKENHSRVDEKKDGIEMEQPIDQNEEKRNKIKVRMELLLYFCALIICVFVIPKYVLQRTIIKGPSMENNFYHGENVLVEKVSVRLDKLKRFDVIVFYPFGKDYREYYMKRLIGMPGETIQITDDGVIYINGEVLEENYGKDPITFGGIASEPLQLGEDEYFVLGDNRSISDDSRGEAVGVVNEKNIDGRVILRIWPFSKFGKIN